MMDFKNINLFIKQISEEKGVPEEQVIEATEAALASAYKKDYGKKPQIIKAQIDPNTGQIKFWQIKLVVDPNSILSEEELAQEAEAESLSVPEEEGQIKKIRFNPEKHILLEEAQKIQPDIQIGQELIIPLEPQVDFSRIAIQTAKQVILQKLHELQKQTIINEFQNKEGEIVSGVVQRIENKNVIVDLGKTYGVLPASESIPGEHFKIGERKKFYVNRLETRGEHPTILLSRAAPQFVVKLFENEVPEIAEGIVEIKAVAREAGSRTKIAVMSHDENIDPVGSCVGQKGVRVTTIIDELNGEKVDIIPYSEEINQFVAEALGPAKIKEVEVVPENREIRVFVAPDQVSLAIGRRGQNVRLAARLTGWKIDVRSSLAPDEVLEESDAGVLESDAGVAVDAEESRQPKPEDYHKDEEKDDQDYTNNE